jgi:hypothetical protein
VLAAEAETPLERQLSLAIMRGGGAPPRADKVQAGAVILAEGKRRTGSSWCSTAWSRRRPAAPCWRNSGPGPCWASALPAEDLQELALGHHREDQ